MNMVRVVRYRFQQCFGPFPCYLWKGPLKRGFLDIYLTTFFIVRKSKNTSAMRVIFFLKKFKIESSLGNAKENRDNIFRFLDNCIWKCCYRLSLLRREYLLSAVNGLTNSPKILHITQRDFFNLEFPETDQ